MLIAGILFDIGVVITCAAFNLPMLYLGRIFLGVAVAFASVAVTLYNSEMAPAHIRGRLNQIFQVDHRQGTVLGHCCMGDKIMAGGARLKPPGHLQEMCILVMLMQHWEAV